MTYIRDPLYGYIKIDKDIRKVLDHEYIQRLRNIKQLGVTEKVYPGATHTRFNHSLGVFYIAGEISDSLDIDKHEKKIIKLAGLLHDIGHGPFSHISERILEKKTENITHEDISCKYVYKMEDVIPVDTDKITKYIKGEDNLNIISGDIDADRMDYLRRDSFYTGVEHGTIDTKSLIEFMNKEKGEIVFDKKAIQSLERLLTARLHMNNSVYSQHACVIAEKMIERAIEKYLEITKENILDIIKYNDNEMAIKLKNCKGIPQEYYNKLNKRNLYKRGLIINTSTHTKEKLKKLNNIVNERQLEQVISDKLNINKNKILIDKPSIPNKNKKLNIKIKQNQNIVNINKISTITQSLKTIKWRNINFAIYAEKDIRNKIKNESIPIIENHYNINLN